MEKPELAEASEFKLIGEVRVGEYIGWVALTIPYSIIIDKTNLIGDRNNLIPENNDIFFAIAQIVRSLDSQMTNYKFQGILIGEECYRFVKDPDSELITHTIETGLQ